MVRDPLPFGALSGSWKLVLGWWDRRRMPQSPLSLGLFRPLWTDSSQALFVCGDLHLVQASRCYLGFPLIYS